MSNLKIIGCLEMWTMIGDSMYWSRKILFGILFSLLIGVDPIICFVKNEYVNHVWCSNCSYSKRVAFYLFIFCLNVTSYIVIKCMWLKRTFFLDIFLVRLKRAYMFSFFWLKRIGFLLIFGPIALPMCVLFAITATKKCDLIFMDLVSLFEADHYMCNFMS